jgi:hypothetical protein
MVTPLTTDSTAMSAPRSSARTILLCRPLVPSSVSSSVIASAAEPRPGPPIAVMPSVIAPAASAGRLNQTALPGTPRDSRDLDRWCPQRAPDSWCTTSRPRPLTASAGARRWLRPGTLPRAQPGRVSNTLQTNSVRSPAPRRYIHSSELAGAGTRCCACSVLAASSLTIATPSSMASLSSPRPLTTRRKTRRAIPAQVGSPGKTHAPHARVSTIRHPSSISVPPA